jgi:hypothetical protein
MLKVRGRLEAEADSAYEILKKIHDQDYDPEEALEMLDCEQCPRFPDCCELKIEILDPAAPRNGSLAN